MKKFKVFLIVILVFTMMSVSGAFAYSEGLLNNKPMKLSDTLTGGTNTSVLTDNQNATYLDLAPDSYVRYDFQGTATLTHVQYKGDGSSAFKGVNIYALKEDGSKSNVHAPYGTLPKTEIINGPLKDVKTVYILNQQATTVRIYEFDVFGEEVSTPTTPPEPTPLATPEATPTPTATPAPTPEQPTGERAILTITLTNGIDKEYDLPIAEVNSFLSWYDSMVASNAPAKYAINKHDNNKDPYSKRTDYIIFDKILTFEVSEYTVTK
jgi:hypothetical protein